MIQQLRSIFMVLAFVVGGIFHAEIAPMRSFLPWGIALMLSITFIGIDVKRLKPRRMHLWVLLVIQLLGFAFWGVSMLLGQPILAECLFYCAMAPIASASPIIVSLLKGDVEFSTTAVVLSHICFGLLMPLLMPLILHAPELSYFHLAGEVAMQLSTVLAIPALVAIILRRIYPSCRYWAPRLRDFSLAVWIVNLTIVAAGGTHRVLEIESSWQEMLPMALGAMVVCAVGFVGGYWLGYPHLKRECSQALGQKNTILTLYMAGQGFASPLAYIGPAFYVFCHNTANAIQLSLAAREEHRRMIKDSPPSP